MFATSNAEAIFISSIVLNFFATGAVLLRIWSRFKNKAGLGSDDWTIAFALVFSIALGIQGAWAAATGVIPKSFASMTPAEHTVFRKCQFVSVLLGHLCFGLVKISVLLFYKRIFTTPRFTKVVKVWLALISLWTFALFICVFFSESFKFDLRSPGVRKQPTFGTAGTGNFIKINSGLDVALDVVIVVLPIPSLRKLHMNTQRKMLLTGVFMLGAFCLIASIIRLKEVMGIINYVSQQRAKNIQGPLLDEGYTRVSEAQELWCRIEAAASVFTACLPTLAPLIGGVRSLESLVGSLRSMLSLRSSRSRSTVAVDEQREKASADYHSTEEKLRNGSIPQGQGRSVVTVGKGGGSSIDLESGKAVKAIVVQQSFGTE